MNNYQRMPGLKWGSRLLPLLSIILLLGCQNDFFGPPQAENLENSINLEPGQGRLILSFGGDYAPEGAKTLVPLGAPAFTKYDVTVYETNAEGTDDTLDEAASGMVAIAELIDGKVELQLYAYQEAGENKDAHTGFYKIKVEGYINDDDLAAFGVGEITLAGGAKSEVIAIVDGQPTEVVVTLRPINPGTTTAYPDAADGKFSWDIKIPAAQNKVARAVFRIYNYLGYDTNPDVNPLPPTDIANTDPYNSPLYNLLFRGTPTDSQHYSGWLGTQMLPTGVTVTPNAITTTGDIVTNKGSVSLKPGTYFVALIIHNDNDIFFGKSEIVHIYSNLETKTYEATGPDTVVESWDYTDSKFYPRILTISGSLDIKVNNADVPQDNAHPVKVYVYTGSDNVGPTDKNREATSFFYPTAVDDPSTPGVNEAKQYSIQIKVPEAGETLQFIVMGYFSDTAKYKIGQLVIPAYQNNESPTIIYNIPSYNVEFVNVSGTLKAQYLGQDGKDMWWLNIEAYEDDAYTKYLSAAGVAPSKTAAGITSFEMILPKANQTYYLKIQAGAEVSGVLPLKTYEKRISVDLPPSGVIDLGTIFSNGKGFTFSGTLTGALANIKDWNGLYDSPPYIGVYEKEDLSGEALGKSLALTDANWSLKAGAPYGTTQLHLALEFAKDGITYRARVGSYNGFADGETQIPAPGQGLLTQADWDNPDFNFREIAVENFPPKTNISLALQAAGNISIGSVTRQNTGVILLFAPADTGNYVVDPMSASLASPFVPNAYVHNIGSRLGGSGALLNLTQNTPYLVLISDPNGRIGNYRMDITKVAGAAGLLQITSAWEVQEVIDASFEFAEYSGVYAFRVKKYDLDVDSVARYFDPAFDRDSAAYKKTVGGDTYILYPWYWSVDGWGWDPDLEWTVYTRSDELAFSKDDINDETGQPRFIPGQIVNVKLTLSKGNVPYSMDWTVHIPE